MRSRKASFAKWSATCYPAVVEASNRDAVRGSVNDLWYDTFCGFP